MNSIVKRYESEGHINPNVV
jgi:hypothetical protein